jgi:hypothetical protein
VCFEMLRVVNRNLERDGAFYSPTPISNCYVVIPLDMSGRGRTSPMSKGLVG